MPAFSQLDQHYCANLDFFESPGLLYINNLPDDVFCNTAIYTNDTTLYSKCNEVSDLWQQLELASEFESDLSDIVDLSESGLLISVLEKLADFV